MNNESLLNLCEIFKNMKCTDVWIHHDYNVYGFDDTNAIFLIYKCDEEIPCYLINTLFNAKDFSKIVKGDLEYKFVGDFDSRFVITNGENHCLISKPNYSPNFSSFYKALINVSRFKHPKFVIKNFNKTEDYKKYFDLKANDGIIKFTINGYPIVMYNKIIPTNKSDDVTLEVYDNDEEYFFVRYIVNKKKNITIYAWTCYLKI